MKKVTGLSTLKSSFKPNPLYFVAQTALKDQIKKDKKTYLLIAIPQLQSSTLFAELGFNFTDAHIRIDEQVAVTKTVQEQGFTEAHCTLHFYNEETQTERTVHVYFDFVGRIKKTIAHEKKENQEQPITLELTAVEQESCQQVVKPAEKIIQQCITLNNIELNQLMTALNTQEQTLITLSQNFAQAKNREKYCVEGRKFLNILAEYNKRSTHAEQDKRGEHIEWIIQNLENNFNDSDEDTDQVCDLHEFFIDEKNKPGTSKAQIQKNQNKLTEARLQKNLQKQVDHCFGALQAKLTQLPKDEIDAELLQLIERISKLLFFAELDRISISNGEKINELLQSIPMPTQANFYKHLMAGEVQQAIRTFELMPKGETSIFQFWRTFLHELARCENNEVRSHYIALCEHLFLTSEIYRIQVELSTMVFGIDNSVEFSYDFAALYSAAEHDHFDVFEMLIKHGCSLNSGTYMMTPGIPALSILYGVSKLRLDRRYVDLLLAHDMPVYESPKTISFDVNADQIKNMFGNNGSTRDLIKNQRNAVKWLPKLGAHEKLTQEGKRLNCARNALEVAIQYNAGIEVQLALLDKINTLADLVHAIGCVLNAQWYMMRTCAGADQSGFVFVSNKQTADLLMRDLTDLEESNPFLVSFIIFPAENNPLHLELLVTLLQKYSDLLDQAGENKGEQIKQALRVLSSDLKRYEPYFADQPQLAMPYYYAKLMLLALSPQQSVHTMSEMMHTFNKMAGVLDGLKQTSAHFYIGVLAMYQAFEYTGDRNLQAQYEFAVKRLTRAGVDVGSLLQDLSETRQILRAQKERLQQEFADHELGITNAPNTLLQNFEGEEAVVEEIVEEVAELNLIPKTKNWFQSN